MICSFAVVKNVEARQKGEKNGKTLLYVDEMEAIPSKGLAEPRGEESGAGGRLVSALGMWQVLSESSLYPFLSLLHPGRVTVPW